MLNTKVTKCLQIIGRNENSLTYKVNLILTTTFENLINNKRCQFSVYSSNKIIISKTSVNDLMNELFSNPLGNRNEPFKSLSVTLYTTKPYFRYTP